MSCPIIEVYSYPLLQISPISMTLITYCGHGNHCLAINNIFMTLRMMCMLRSHSLLFLVICIFTLVTFVIFSILQIVFTFQLQTLFLYMF